MTEYVKPQPRVEFTDWELRAIRIIEAAEAWADAKRAHKAVLDEHMTNTTIKYSVDWCKRDYAAILALEQAESHLLATLAGAE